VGAFRKRKHGVEASELAQSLLDEFIRKIVADVKDLQLDAPTRERYEAKTRLYQFAAVLIALIREERTNTRFLAVRDHLERCIFPPSLDQGKDLLTEVRAAMRDLGHLLDPGEERRRKEMSWARAWLQEIGVDETNPATLALFAIHWMEYFIMVTKSLREFSPVA